MAYLNQDEEETQGQGLNQSLGQTQGQPQQPAPQDDSQPQGQSSAPATIGATNTTQPSAPMPKQKAGTGTFTNLRNFLQANQGNRVASAASQRVANVASGAQRGIQQAEQTFGQRVEQGSLRNMSGARQEAQGIVQAGTQATFQAPAAPQPQTQQAAPQTTQAPTPQAQPSVFSEEQRQRFQEILNAQYRGPQSLQQAGLYEPAAQRVRTATQAGQQTQTATGREQLLKDIFGQRRDYTRGQNKLDALLLNTSEQGVRSLQEQGARAAATQGILDAAQNTSANLAQQRIADTQALRQNVRQDFTQAQQALEQGVNQRIDAMTTAIAKDEQGNPIQKRDASGKPVVDAEGKPVFLTEWERLPNYFREAIINREATNKAAQERQIQEVRTRFGAAATPEFSAQLQANQERLRRLQGKLFTSGKDFSAIGGPSYRRLSDQETARIQSEIASLTPAIQRDSKLLADYNAALAPIQGQNLRNLNLSAEEAAMLGIGQGTGLYNLTADAIQTAAADRTRLISKDELTRLQALSQLAGLDEEKALRTQILSGDPNYNMERAGTQTALDALDRAATQAQFRAAEQAFAEQARNQNITGTGSKKHRSSGKRYYADETANLADVLERAGYKFNAESPELMDQEQLARQMTGQRITDEDMPGIIGEALSPYQDNTSAAAKGLSGFLDTSTAGANALLRGLGVDIGGAISGALGFGGPSSRYAKNIAAQGARRDLQRKLQSAINQSGFTNRATVGDTEETRARTEALRQILASRDKTNR